MSYHHLTKICRITPACAGKTNPFFRGTSLIQNHSRVCGKKLTDGISGLTGSGSPLHVQEKHFEDAVKICIRRITPACAGKTVFLVQMMKHHQDHPRVCGKNSNVCGIARICPGSPPRVREKQNHHSFGFAQLGITPACAGKTRCLTNFPECSEDHPRVCGKNVEPYKVNLALTGSPPRVREKLFAMIAAYGSSRITPACAGKTALLPLISWVPWDHPRVCGKNL